MKKTTRGYFGPGCPRCWTEMPRSVLEQGKVYCGECALEFTAAAFDPAEPPRPQPRPVEGGAAGEAQCARHARNAAVAACERCGAFMCALCRIDTDGKVLCAACFDRLRSEGALESARTTFRSWRTLGLHLSIAGIPFYVFGVIIGPAAIVAAVRGIKQDRQSGDEGGTWSAIISILLGATELVMGAVLILAAAGALGKK